MILVVMTFKNIIITLLRIIKHKFWVIIYAFKFVFILIGKSFKHDLSKFSKKEFPFYCKDANRFKYLKFGSEEFKEYKEYEKPAFENHCKLNSHHIEHYKNGINGMSLFDLIEMIYLDWQSAIKCNKKGNIFNSIIYTHEKYKYTREIKNIFMNTFNEKNLQFLLFELYWLLSYNNINLLNCQLFFKEKIDSGKGYYIDNCKHNLYKRIITNNKKIVNRPNYKKYDKLIKIKDLKKKKCKLNVIAGSYDGLHIEHLKGFEYVKQYNDNKLCIIVFSDRHIRDKKGLNRPFFNINERIELLNNIEFVDYIIYTNKKDCKKVLNGLKPQFMFIQEANLSQKSVIEEINLIKDYNGKIVYFSHSQIISISNLTENYLREYKDGKYSNI